MYLFKNTSLITYKMFTRRTHQQARHSTEQWAGTKLIGLCYLKYSNAKIITSENFNNITDYVIPDPLALHLAILQIFL